MNGARWGKVAKKVRRGALCILFTLLVADLAAAQATGTGKVEGCHNPHTQPEPKPEKGGGSEDCPPDSGTQNSGSGSTISNVTLEHFHLATDYATKLPEASGCEGCQAELERLREAAPLPSLTLERIHRPRVFWRQSMFGPMVFSNFDQQLEVRDGGVTKGATITLFTPMGPTWGIEFAEKGGPEGEGDIDGVLWPAAGALQLYHSLMLYDAAGSLTGDAAAVATAVVRQLDGKTLHFEMIRTSAATSTNYNARLVREEDRNGNAITLNYEFPAGASDAELGYRRSKLWRIATATDAYGNAMRFSYAIAGAWWRDVVTQVELPNGRVVRYKHNGSVSSLHEIEHPDGSKSTFVHGEDDVAQQHVIYFDDPAAGTTHRRKTVFFSRNVWVNAATGQQSSQPEYLIRRLYNGEGELVYLNEEDPSSPTATYIYDANRGFFRYKNEYWYSEVAFAKDWDLTRSPQTYQYATCTERWTGAHFRTNRRRDALGRETTYEYDPATAAATNVTFPDGTTRETTVNEFGQPLEVVDRLGRIERSTYDERGNLLMRTVAAGTPSEATWRYEYNSRGQIVRQMAPDYSPASPDLHVTEFVYDERGYLTEVVEAADVAGGARGRTSYVIDTVGRLAAATGPGGRQADFEWDNLNRLSRVTYADGSSESYAYGTGVDANLLVEQTDRNGGVTRYSYDRHGRLISTTRAYGRPEASEKRCGYHNGGLALSYCVDGGRKTSYGYDYKMHRSHVTEHATAQSALTTSREFDVLSRTVFTEDPYGRREYLVYDINNRVKRTVRELVPGAVLAGSDLAALAREQQPNPAYVIEEFAYNAEGELTRKVDGRGAVMEYELDAQGRTAAEVEALGTPTEARTEFEFDAAGNTILIRHPRTFTETGSFVTVFTYTGRNLLASETVAYGTPLAATRTLSYTLTGKKASESDYRGNVTTLAYDPDTDRLVEHRDPSGAVATFAYDPHGNPVRVTDANGYATALAYDGLHRQVSRTNGEAETTTYAYDDNLADGVGVDADAALVAGLGFSADASAGSAVVTTNALGERSVTIRDGARRVVRQIDANGNATTYTFDTVTDGLVEEATIDALGHGSARLLDGNKLVRRSIDAEGAVTLRSFDAAGNELSVVDPNGNARTCSFDERSRRAACTDAQGDTSGWAYDAASNVIALTDALGQTTSYGFDARNRKVSETDRLGGITRFAYDADSNITSVMDAEGSVTRYDYDIRGLLVREEFPPQQSTAANIRTYTYDAGRRLSSCIDQTGLVTGYTYDGANRLTARVYPDGLDDTYAYDDASRLVEAVSHRYDVRVTRTYDPAGRLRSEIQSLDETDYTVGYAYDAADRKTEITYPDGSKVQRAYTSRHELEGVWHQGSLIASRSYDAGMRLVETTLGNGLSEQRTYRPDNLLATLTTAGINELSYSYDANKRVLGETNAVLERQAQSYGYDQEDRLIDWARGTAGVAEETQSWNLSLVGDWASTTRNGEVETRAHTAAHELKSLTRGGNSVPLEHDEKGNLTLTQNGQALFWDVENRLEAAGPTLEASESIRINFQTATAPIPEGYVADTGKLFGDRGNGLRYGLSYGWTEDRTSYTRERKVHPDKRYDTLVHMNHLNQQVGASWELELPNGQYRVHLVMGDPSYQDQTNNVTIEGVPFVDPDPWDKSKSKTAFGDFDEVEVDVTVTDGRLTIALAQGHYNVKLCFLDVTRLDAPSATASALTGGTYRYDALGRRLQKTARGVTTTYVHDGPQVLAEYENTALARKYIHGTYVDEPLAMVAAGQTLYYHQNRIYSVMALTNAEGSVVERYAYTPYGARTITSADGEVREASAVGNDVGFTGRYWDAETALWYYRARQMDPELGRFVGRDPIGDLGYVRFAGAPTLGYSPYGYGAHSPAEYVDPMGEQVCGVKCEFRVGSGIKCEPSCGKEYPDHTWRDMNKAWRDWVEGKKERPQGPPSGPSAPAPQASQEDKALKELFGEDWENQDTSSDAEPDDTDWGQRLFGEACP
jgi:RHS repeat-associated protein